MDYNSYEKERNFIGGTVIYSKFKLLLLGIELILWTIIEGIKYKLKSLLSINPKKELITDNLTDCYIVIGPPRSGTSVLSNILSNAEIDFGNKCKGANQYNPKGFFEDKGLVNTNSKLFRFMTEGRGNNDLGFFLSRTHKDRIKEVFHMNQVRNSLKNIDKRTKQNWGIKDPRLCITFRRLHKYFYEPKPIYIIRDPKEFVISEVMSGGSSPTKAFNLWNECVLNILNYKIKYGGPIILYHLLMQRDVKTLETIKEYSNLNDNNIFDCIEDKYYRSKGDIPIPKSTQELWDRVKDLECYE